MLNTKEHYDLMAQFEKDCCPGRKDKEPQSLWARGIIYQEGAVNELFKAYRHGYALGKVNGRHD